MRSRTLTSLSIGVLLLGGAARKLRRGARAQAVRGRSRPPPALPQISYFIPAVDPKSSVRPCRTLRTFNNGLTISPSHIAIVARHTLLRRKSLLSFAMKATTCSMVIIRPKGKPLRIRSMDGSTMQLQWPTAFLAWRSSLLPATWELRLRYASCISNRNL